ncbi:MAG: lipooligosaccharide sialyltransferase [Lachnospiraceae bacterium]|nr:lipooligosaccharide sialyltransferase [Lachnospiraceae bacterium]
MKERIYVCHTYYHVYVAFLKELFLPDTERGKATLLLSTISCNFENLKDRIDRTGLFAECIPFHEKLFTDYPELLKYNRPRNNILLHLLQRIIFTKKYGRLTAKTVPVNMREYKDIYVFCDADPIGYYLNCYRIPYHAVEDGLNSVVNCDGARYDNRGHFGIKAFLSERLNLIFIQSGYGKYCIDMEVNDVAAIKYPYRKYVEVRRQDLIDHLTEQDKELILSAFLRNRAELEEKMASAMGEEKKILILTEPLCDLKTRERIFRDLTERYAAEGTVFLKPHPRDELDYAALFPDIPIIDATVPMEILNYFPNICFDKAVAVLTEVSGIHFAKETVRLGTDFMDAYEDPLIHRQNEQI